MKRQHNRLIKINALNESSLGAGLRRELTGGKK